MSENYYCVIQINQEIVCKGRFVVCIGNFLATEKYLRSDFDFIDYVPTYDSGRPN